MVLECCLAARAQHLITGDRDLLEFDSWVWSVPECLIVTPASDLLLEALRLDP